VTGDPQNRYRVEGTGQVLVYVPGLDGTGQLFFKQGPRLATSHRVVTFRPRDDGRFTYENLTDDVAAIIRDLGERQATILGESFGGTVALWFALRYPQMVKQLVVVNSFPRFRKRLTIKLGVKLASGLPFRLLWPVRRAANTLGLLVDGVNRDDRKRFWSAIRTVSADAYARRLQLIEELNLESRLSEIQTPTLLIAGDRDLLIPSVKEAHAMAARMPKARVRVVEGAGHACLMGSRVRLDELLAE
jgi:pimeloyl-ACP methyl ester carboxylesterase